MKPSTWLRRICCVLKERRLAINFLSAFSIELSPMRNAISMPTESRLSSVTAISSSMSVTPRLRVLIAAAAPPRP
jgi:hypothetical protein